MVRIQYGGRQGQVHEFAVSDEHLAVRTCSRAPMMTRRSFEMAPLAPETYTMLAQHFELTTRFRDAGVEILQTKVPQPDGSVRDQAREVLKTEPEVEFAGRVIVDIRSNRPMVYTENFFIKFGNTQTPEACQQILQRYNLLIKRRLTYARNAYFVAAPEGTGLAVFAIAAELLQEEAVDLCHPELVSDTRERKVFSPQWHLKSTTVNNKLIEASANVEAAWSLSNGTGAIVAIVDDGVDIDHEEFRSSGKIVAPWDVTRQIADPRPGRGEEHGTACAGVACANGIFGASGVAPGAKLIPIRLASGLGSQAEADAFVWAARNGADVISCSWGPQDGAWWDASDPIHNQVVPLPDSTRLAIDYAINQGRNGKGCVVIFAAGNGNESVDNDGYASNPKVIAVAASNDVGVRSAYSDFGKAVWCTFPSNDGRPSLTPGIWTTDRTGTAGYNSGNALKGDTAGNYTNAFGGTSSAAPGVAGVAALVVARNPDLRWDQVREILKQSCDQIDVAGGNYDATGRSPFYGYGRVNARKAVELAIPSQPNPTTIYKMVQDIPVKDMDTARLQLSVTETQPSKSIKVTVDIEHPYIGDLVVTLLAPTAMGIKPIVLHDRTGGSTDNIKKTYDAVNLPALGGCIGKVATGIWTLEVADKAIRDSGKIRSFTLAIEV